MLSFSQLSITAPKKVRGDISALYLCGKVIAELELFEEGRHEDGGKKEDDTPEENIGNIRSMRATGTAHKLALLFNTVLQKKKKKKAALVSILILNYVFPFRFTFRGLQQGISFLHITLSFASSTPGMANLGPQETLLVFQSLLTSLLLIS